LSTLRPESLQIIDDLASVKGLKDSSKRAQKLVNLIPELTTPDLLSQALEIAAKISNPAACVLVLSKLSPHLGSDQILEAIIIASGIDQPKSRTIATTNLSSRFIPNLVPKVIVPVWKS
jgi:hypothetical protein